MRILLAARHSPFGPKPIGGVQSWNRTVGENLTARGHEVHQWEPGRILSGIFDFGIFSNCNDTRPAMKFCRQHIAVCHGIIEPERPPAKDVVFTSEEVRDFWNVDGPVVRQPIDLNFWSPSPRNLAKKYFTRFSYRQGLDFLVMLAKESGLMYHHLKNSNRDMARNILRQSAVVFASGRAALEAMACGAPVVLCDHRQQYQDALMDLNLLQAMEHNYSGRGGIAPDENNVRQAAQEAIANGSQRSHVEKYHNAHGIVNMLLGFAQ